MKINDKNKMLLAFIVVAELPERYLIAGHSRGFVDRRCLSVDHTDTTHYTYIHPSIYIYIYIH